MCKRTYWSKEKIGDMNFKIYKKIINQFKFLNNVCLTGLGESLLNRDIFKIIHHAKSVKKIGRVWIISNGTLIDEKMAVKLCKSGLDSIVISLDGATAKTYEKIRKGAKFDVVLRNLKNLYRIRNKLNKNMSISISFTVLKENFREMFNIIKLIHSFVDYISMSGVNYDFPGKKNIEFVVSEAKVEQLKGFAKKLGTTLYYSGYYNNRCLFPWYFPYITWDGFVTPCCEKPDPEEFNFGNIVEEPLKKIWNNEKMKAFRTALTSGNPPDICKNCPHLMLMKK